MAIETLRQYRKRNGLTLANLAEKVDVTEGQLSRIETTGRASLSTALKIQAETGIPPERLTGAQDAAA